MRTSRGLLDISTGMIQERAILLLVFRNESLKILDSRRHCVGFNSRGQHFLVSNFADQKADRISHIGNH